MNRYMEIEEKHKAERRELTDRVDQERLHSHPGDYMLAYGIGYIRMEDREKAFSMNSRHRSELKDLIEEDTDGTGFIYDMFIAAMHDTEYALTDDVKQVIDILDMTEEDIQGNPALQRGFLKAQEHYRRKQGDNYD